ncbi:MAG: ABC transporter ATP-binding protein [Geminicoccaceae bacterium]
MQAPFIAHRDESKAPAAAPVPKLAVASVTKRFDRDGASGLLVLDSLSFEVADLDFLVIVGPSGCGKSTLLRIIDGLESPDSGTILVDGAKATGPGPGRAMVFQSFDLFPWRTAIENITFGLEVRGVGRRERLQIGQHYIDLVGLTGFEDAYPHQLSGGMQQRVGIARALAVKPDVLLMDEPFGALDIQTRDLLQDELLRIFDTEKKTVIFVTHSIEEAIYLADRIIVLSPRPARICMDVQVPFPRPRNEDIKGEPRFIEIRREIWQMLKQAVFEQQS